MRLNVEDLITQTEAGRLRGVSRTTIHNYVKSGHLTSLKIGDKIFVFRSEVKRLKVKHNVRTDEQLLNDVRRVARKLRRVPSSFDYKRHGKIHLSTVSKQLGGWSNVVAALEGRAP